MVNDDATYDPPTDPPAAAAPERPVLLTPDELSALAPELPADASALGGIHFSIKKAMVIDPHPSVTIVYAAADGTIHSVVATEGPGGRVDLSDDHVIGAW